MRYTVERIARESEKYITCRPMIEKAMEDSISSSLYCEAENDWAEPSVTIRFKSLPLIELDKNSTAEVEKGKTRWIECILSKLRQWLSSTWVILKNLLKLYSCGFSNVIPARKCFTWKYCAVMDEFTTRWLSEKPMVKFKSSSSTSLVPSIKAEEHNIY